MSRRLSSVASVAIASASPSMARRLSTSDVGELAADLGDGDRVAIFVEPGDCVGRTLRAECSYSADGPECPAPEELMFDKFREECGVFGIFGASRGCQPHVPRAVRAAAPRAGERRHRRVRRQHHSRVEGDGLRQRGLRRGHAGEAAGQAAVGHVRYSTAGESRLANAQPIVIDSVHGQLALCHNGNLVNASEVNDDARARQGSIFQASTRQRSRRPPVCALAGARCPRPPSSRRSRRCAARFPS